MSAVAFVEAFVNDVVDRQKLAISKKTNPIDKRQDALDAIGRPRLNTGGGTALSADLQNRLKNRENRQQIGEPRFPKKLLGAGCAEWAVDTSVAFALEWHTAMGLDAAEFDRIRNLTPDALRLCRSPAAVGGCTLGSASPGDWSLRGWRGCAPGGFGRRLCVVFHPRPCGGAH